MHITRVSDCRHDGSTQNRAWNDPTGQRTCNASRELFAAFLRRKQATVVLIGFSQGLLERPWLSSQRKKAKIKTRSKTTNFYLLATDVDILLAKYSDDVVGFDFLGCCFRCRNEDKSACSMTDFGHATRSDYKSGIATFSIEVALMRLNNVRLSHNQQTHRKITT